MRIIISPEKLLKTIKEMMSCGRTSKCLCTSPDLLIAVERDDAVTVSLSTQNATLGKIMECDVLDDTRGKLIALRSFEMVRVLPHFKNSVQLTRCDGETRHDGLVERYLEIADEYKIMRIPMSLSYLDFIPPHNNIIVKPRHIYFDGVTLRKAIENALPHITKDANRPVLTGVSVIAKGSTAIIAATDGRTIGETTIPMMHKNLKEHSFYMPKDMCRYILKNISKKEEGIRVGVAIGDNSNALLLSIRDDGVTKASATIPRSCMTYPDYRKAFCNVNVTDGDYMVLDRDEIIEACKTAASLMNKKEDPKATLICRWDGECARAFLAAIIEGRSVVVEVSVGGINMRQTHAIERFRGRFNPEYLARAIGIHESGPVKVYFNGGMEDSPLIFHTEANENVRSLLMSLRARGKDEEIDALVEQHMLYPRRLKA